MVKPGRSSSSADDRPSPGLPTASATDTARVLAVAVAPIVAQGVIARRRHVVALAGKLETDDRGVRLLQQLNESYGPGPLRLRIPGRSVALPLVAEDVRRVLEGTPEPFSPANREKRGALGHFQPHGVLVSRGAARTDRRRFNEGVLDTGRPLHRCADSITRVVRQEARELLEEVDGSGVLTWDAFLTAWWRVVRRVVLGDGARDDHELTDQLTRLRRAANWSALVPRSTARHARLRNRLRTHLDRAEPGSLAAMVASVPVTPETDAVDQLPQWLFAFDPAGAVALRALALLAVHPEETARVRADLEGRDLDTPQDLPRLRTAVLESVRLWPTTPLLLRDTTAPTEWNGATLPAGTAVLIATSYFHRDDRVRSDADRFDPDQWLDGRGDDDWSLVPFSAGPGTCPGRELVLFTTSTFLATLLEGHNHTVLPPTDLDPSRPLPRGLDPFAIRLTLTPTGPAQASGG
ncbi:cytochrome P450 [Pseudonocardia bannensis]|uniref:Cytochrome P450 n=1 Tax=Pseudonocardia bannensis TaxID=630973 RepID=A0A848DJ34_9PSEU|nr:cytochrome P450 [Pseudonocardia bannensis]NMH92546.1 cytochrome P450 [Pseudonocardia bannensis]